MSEPAKKIDSQKMVRVEIHPESHYDMIDLGKDLKLEKGKPVEVTIAESEELLKIIRNNKPVCQIVKEVKK